MLWILIPALMLVTAALSAAVWGGEAAGAFLAAMFHLLGSAALARYLLSGLSLRWEPGRSRRKRPAYSRSEQAPVSRGKAPRPGTEPVHVHDDGAQLQDRVDAVLADCPEPCPPAAVPEPQPDDFPPDPPLHTFITHCAVMNPNFQLARGHSLELRATGDGIMEVCDLDGTLVVYVRKNLEDVGVDLKRLGILSVFEICDESDMLLQDFPAGRLRVMNLKPAVCEEYGDNLRLVKRGRLLVKAKPQTAPADPNQPNNERM